MPRHSQLPILKNSDKIRFWNNVKIGPENECWNWVGAKVEYGRVGVFQKNNKNIRVPRIAYQISNGEFDEKLIVKQECNNNFCCNPNHLYLCKSDKSRVIIPTYIDSEKPENSD